MQTNSGLTPIPIVVRAQTNSGSLIRVRWLPREMPSRRGAVGHFSLLIRGGRLRPLGLGVLVVVVRGIAPN